MMNKHITLCKPGRVPVCVLNGVDINTVNYTQKFNDLDEITFTVDKYIETENGDRIFSNGYEKLHAFMEIYVDNIGYFQIKEPEISNEINKETKTVTGVSIATELLQKDLVGFTVNTSTTSSLEMLADNNINSLGYPNEYITFYNPTNKQLSLLDLVLEKAVGWNVGEVDDFLKNQRYSFDNINENIFSFLTKTLSSTARCIFKFDTMNKTVSAYSENHIGNDTGIVIAERNLLNSIDIQCDSDNIYTRLNVQGKDSLNFADINYGDTHIFNLDYYSNLDYMSQDLIDALGVWQNARNDGRDEYISKVKTYQSYLEQISEIDNKVPTNGVLNNWDNMSMDELNKNLTYYNSLIKELQIVAQNTHPKAGETEYVGSLDDYSPSRLKSDGTVDHDSYMNDLDGQGKETYREVITYVIPNIEIAIENFDLTKDGKKDYFEDYLTDWDLYGLVELKAKQSSYEDQIGTLKAYQKGWNELTEEEKASHGDNEATYTQYHEEYEKLDGYLTAIKNKATELQDKKDKLVSSRDTLSEELSTIRSNMSINGGRYVDGSFVKWFTEEQLSTINLLFHDTDYTNENILITKLNDFSSKLDIEKELYADAEKELSELSVPQYTFSCSLDNLLSMDEFSCWHNDFKVGNFITLEVGKGVLTKLRLISISYNPFIKTNDLTVEFSNMITGKDGRNDFSYIFDKAISASKNSITLSNNNAKDDIELSIEMLNLLSNSSVFQGKFDNLNLKSAVISESAIVKLTADFAKITELDAKYATIENLSATNATITELNANVANIEKAYIKKIDADEIYAKTADVDTLLAGYVKSDVASIGTLFYKVGLIDRSTTVEGHITGFLDAVEINANSITAGTLVADRILLKAPEGSSQKGLLYAINKFGNIESTSVDTIDGNILTDRTITADKLIANSITANELDVDKIFGSEAVLNKIVSQQIFSDAVSSNSLVVSANANALVALNQKIGGRNILLNSKLKNNSDKWATQLVTNGSFADINLDYTTKYSRECAHINMASLNQLKIVYQSVIGKLESNMTYTLSGWVLTENITRGTTEYLASFIVDGISIVEGTQSYFSYGNKAFPVNSGSGKWEHLEYTFTTDDSVVNNPISLNACIYVRDLTGDIYFCDLKLEKGSKATDWTPAIEDTENAISEASIANWCYNNDTTYIDGGKVYAGTITAEQIRAGSLTIESFTENAVNTIKMYSTDAVKNLQIGGRNLFLNSKFDNNDLKWLTLFRSNNVDSSFNLEYVTKYNRKCAHFNMSSFNQLKLVYQPILDKLETNTTYTFSGWVLAENIVKGSTEYFARLHIDGAYHDENGNLQFLMYGSDAEFTSNSGNGKWEFLSYTFTTDEIKFNSAVSLTAYVYTRDLTGDIYFCDLKLEKGNKPTDWTPAPEDVETSIANVETIATQTADKFNWLVKSGTNETDFTLTDRTATLISDYINLNGLVTFNGLGSDAIDTIKGYSTAAIDGLKIGGRNLLLGTGTISTIEGTNTVDQCFAYHDLACGSITKLEAGEYTCYADIIGTVEGGTAHLQFFDTPWETIPEVSGNVIVKPVKQRMGGTFTLSSPQSFRAIGMRVRMDGVSGTVTVSNMKLEKGNKATDWSPAPEDAENAISAASIANWCYNNDITYIDGGKIYTGTITAEKIAANAITAEKIATDAIKSTNYVANTSGSFLNLADGSWDSKNFKIDTTGNITATGGTLGGWDFDGKIMKKLLVNGTTDTEKRYVFINTRVTTGSWDGTTLASPKGRVLGINSEINEYIGTQTTMGTAGALYINADGSISATSLDKKSTFDMSDGNIYLVQTKELAGQSESTYRCWMQGNVLTFCKLKGDKLPDNGYMYIGEVANEVAGTLGLRGKKGIFSDVEDLYVATGGNLRLQANLITASEMSVSNIRGQSIVKRSITASTYINGTSSYDKMVSINSRNKALLLFRLTTGGNSYTVDYFIDDTNSTITSRQILAINKVAIFIQLSDGKLGWYSPNLSSNNCVLDVIAFD